MQLKLLRINMSDLSHNWEDLPNEYETLAGRALTSTIIAKEVDPTCDPLREKNKIVISPGLLAGTLAPSSGRLSIGAKSPLTGGIKEANAGGITGQKIGRLGIRAIVIEGKPNADINDWYTIIIKKESCEIKKTNEYAGKGLYELISKVWEDFSSKPGIIGCGIAGQRLSPAAGVFGNNINNTDPGRYAARGGLGAVFGSKRVVAVITDDTGGERPEPKNKEDFENYRKKFTAALMNHPITGRLKDDNGELFGGLKNYGTSIFMNLINEAGGLPTRNFKRGNFMDAAKVSGEAIHDLVDEMKKKFGDSAEGLYGHPCHPGCVIACSNAIPNENTGKRIVAPLEFESIWAFGPNLGIGDLKVIAELTRLCNDLGLDTIETGVTLGVIMEADLIKFGDGKAAIEALKLVYDEKSALGRLCCSGASNTGKVLGITRVPSVKGQSIPAYDPRHIRGMGVTFASTPMGADHTAGYTILAEIMGLKGFITDPRLVKKAALSRTFQTTSAYIDASGYCLFIAFSILDDDDAMAGMVGTVNSFLGQEITVGNYGTDILRKEIDFNKRAGFTDKDNRLPEFFYNEPVPPHNVVFEVPDKEIKNVFKRI